MTSVPVEIAPFEAEAAPEDRVAARRAGRRPALLLAGLCFLVVACLMVPLLFLVIQAVRVGWAEVSHILFRHLTATLLWNTISLVAVVTAASAALGTAAAWATERADLPGRRVFAVLLVLPVAIPDFVIAWGWASIVPGLHGLAGASLVLTLGLYPLVYLPVAASLRSIDPAEEEVARSLGRGPWRTFFSITLRQSRFALLGGCLLVALYLLAEFGAFSILRFQTFTTVIYEEFQIGFNTPAAAALSLVLVVLGLIVLTGEAVANRSGRRTGPRAGARSRVVSRTRLRRSRVPVTAGVAALVGLAVGVPAGTIAYWMTSGQTTSLPAASSLAGAAWHTALYSASAAALTTMMALPIAILAVRHGGRLAMLLERTSLVVQALPGLVVALALVFFAVRYAHVLYQSALLLIAAYTVMFFPLALIAVRASVARVPPALEEVARSLGHRPLFVFFRVTLPLVAPGVLAAFFLVFLTAVTELTATLVLVPTGVQTLATQFWAYSSGIGYGSAAPFAATMLGVAVVPTYLLGRWFDRLPQGATVAR